jgi:hypothetical protein
VTSVWTKLKKSVSSAWQVLELPPEVCAMLTLGPRSSWIQLAVVLAMLALLIQMGGAWLIRATIWTAVIALSIYSVVRAFRGQGHTTDPTVGLPSGLRRWLMGEPKTP